MPRLTDPLDVGGTTLPNRLYRAPLLECAGTGEGAVDRLVAELEPAAEAGAGLVCQGAVVVRGEGGCTAPGMTRVHDPDFVARMGRVPDAVHDHGGRIVAQLEHGGLRTMRTWHAEYAASHPDLQQLAVSRPPRTLRLLDRLGVLHLNERVLSTEEVVELAADFGRAAASLVDAGYDGIHIAGANAGIVQQFLSPYYNRRDDRFGGDLAGRTRFLEAVHDEIRDRAGDVPLLTKVPAETATPSFVRRHLTRPDGVAIAERAAEMGFDAVVPVECSVVWDMSIVRGSYPDRAWDDERFRAGYEAAFGGPWRARAVAALNRLESLRFDRDPGWNEAFCRTVREGVDVPVLMEGGVRSREQIDRLLGRGDAPPACDAVGMARPFYAEPRLPARLLAGADRALCRSCNNCTVPQATGARGVCRTPDVLADRGELEATGAYDR